MTDKIDFVSHPDHVVRDLVPGAFDVHGNPMDLSSVDLDGSVLKLVQGVNSILSPEDRRYQGYLKLMSSSKEGQIIGPETIKAIMKNSNLPELMAYDSVGKP